MFEMIRRVFKIAGNSRGKIVAGIVCNILKSFFNGFMMFGVFWILLHLDNLTPTIIGQAFCVILGSVLGRVKRSKSRSCLHDKTFELGTRQTRESSDLRSKSADFECLRIVGAALQRSNSWISG